MITNHAFKPSSRLALAAVMLLTQSSPAWSQNAPSNVVAGYNALASRDFKRSNVLLAQAVTAEPRNTAARRYFAASLAASGRAAEAISQIQVAQQIDGKQPSDDVLMGNAYLAMADLNCAKRSYSSAVMSATTYSAGAMGLIRVSLCRNDVAQAIKISDALSIRTLSPAESAELQTLKKEISRHTIIHIEEPSNVIGQNNG